MERCGGPDSAVAALADTVSVLVIRRPAATAMPLAVMVGMVFSPHFRCPGSGAADRPFQRRKKTVKKRQRGCDAGVVGE
ncbi:hypothetical protein GCM10027589_52190 [Actinocorallia lasiicapitis]